jgi:hypothetical protein
MTALAFHPLSEIFPLLEEGSRAFQTLSEDIRQYGLRERIVLYEGQVLDGRNRYRACQGVGVEPIYREFTPEIDGVDPLDFVISKNASRRHLTVGQLAGLAHNLQTTTHGDASRFGKMQTANHAANSRRFSKVQKYILEA